MKNDKTLAPAQRVDFGEALLPPDGYRLEAALGTSFSMDIATALTVPVTLALRGGMERDELLDNPLAALAAMRRLEHRLRIYVEAGNIYPPPGKRNALVTLLEDIAVEVPPPRGASFHPKLWLMRFKPEAGGPMRQRLVLMSRNLTRDRSWDVALRLEGEEGAEAYSGNAALTGLLDWLPGRMPDHLREMCDALEFVHWTPPQGFRRLQFHAHYPGSEKPWRPGKGRLAVISPFCDDAALDLLGRDRIVALVACDDWLARLSNTPPRCMTLADHALPEQEASESDERAGLHAKLYVVENRDDMQITLGSGNATAAGLAIKAMRNIELFATLRGKTATVGGIGTEGEGLLGSGGLGPLLEPWTPRPLRPDEIASQAFDDSVRHARQAIFAARPRLQFAPEDERLAVTLALRLPELPGIARVQARLVTQPHATPLEGAGPWALGSVRLADATRFLQIDLTGSHGGTAAFVTQVRTVQGLPDHDQRLRALLSDMIRTPDQFLAFIAAMLETRPDIGGIMRAASRGGGGGKNCPSHAPPVLEALLAVCLTDDGPTRLAELDRMLVGLTPDADAGEMQEFASLWAEFRIATGKRR